MLATAMSNADFEASGGKEGREVTSLTMEAQFDVAADVLSSGTL